MYKKMCMIFGMMVVSMCTAVADTPVMEHVPVVMTPAEWDALYFVPLTDENKKMVLSILKSNRQLLAVVRKDVLHGADAFLKAYSDIVQYHQQSMTLFLPTPNQALGCSMLPCAKSYHEALEIYRVHEPLIQALEVVPSIYTVWQRLSDFLPTDPHAGADELKRGVTKALRNKQLKMDIKQAVQEQITYLNSFIEYINTQYAQVAREQEQLEVQVEELIQKMKQEQAMAQ
jgi:hypothetical protein